MTDRGSGRSAGGGGVEIVVGGVRDFNFGAALGVVAAGSGRRTAFGVEALDERDAAEGAVAGVGIGVQQQPGDGVRLRGIVLGGDFAGHFAAVFMFPGGAAEMAANLRAVVIEESGFGGFEHPGGFLVCGRLADVDLRAGAAGTKDQLLAGGHPERFRHIGRRRLLREAVHEQGEISEGRERIHEVLPDRSLRVHGKAGETLRFFRVEGIQLWRERVGQFTSRAARLRGRPVTNDGRKSYQEIFWMGLRFLVPESFLPFFNAFFAISGLQVFSLPRWAAGESSMRGAKRARSRAGIEAA